MKKVAENLAFIICIGWACLWGCTDRMLEREQFLRKQCEKKSEIGVYNRIPRRPELDA